MNTVEGNKISEYWKNMGVTQKNEGRVYKSSIGYICDECCNGDRCDDPTHRRRENCRACLGTAQNLTSERLNKEKNHELCDATKDASNSKDG